MRSKKVSVYGQRTSVSFQTINPFSAFILTILILATPLAAFAQTPRQPKPVARLVSSSRQTVPAAPRARLVASIPVSRIPDSGRVASTQQISPVTVSRAMTASAFAGASSLERRAFDLINAERRERNESPLVWDAGLSRMARQHSMDMARSGYLDHRGPDGLDMAERARAMGIRGWRALGENIAFNQGFDDPSAFAFERWMGSSKHRANILNSQFTRTGIGVARAADGSIYFTQVFMN